MREERRDWLIRVLTGGGLGLVLGLAVISWLTDSRAVPPTLCALCAALGAMSGVATLPFADDGRTLFLRSLAHFAATVALFALLVLQLGAGWSALPAWMGILALLYAIVWLGRWVGWCAEVARLRVLLGLAPGPTPLKWRETAAYLPFLLLLCDGVPLLLRWLDHSLSADVPVLSGLILPYLLLPVGGFCSGLSLGKRRGLCPLYPAAGFLCYLPMVYLLFNESALFHCFMVAVPALTGNLIGWLWRWRRERLAHTKEGTS